MIRLKRKYKNTIKLTRLYFTGNLDLLFIENKRIKGLNVPLCGDKNQFSWILRILIFGTLWLFHMIKMEIIIKLLNSIKKQSNSILKIRLLITTAPLHTNHQAKWKTVKNSTEKSSKSIPGTHMHGIISPTSTKTKRITNKLLNFTSMQLSTILRTLWLLSILEYVS